MLKEFPPGSQQSSAVADQVLSFNCSAIQKNITARLRHNLGRSLTRDPPYRGRNVQTDPDIVEPSPRGLFAIPKRKTPSPYVAFSILWVELQSIVPVPGSAAGPFPRSTVEHRNTPESDVGLPLRLDPVETADRPRRDCRQAPSSPSTDLKSRPVPRSLQRSPSPTTTHAHTGEVRRPGSGCDRDCDCFRCGAEAIGFEASLLPSWSEGVPHYRERV